MKWNLQKTIAFKSAAVNPAHIQMIEETCKNFNAAITVKQTMFNKTEATVLIINANTANELAEVFYWIGSTFPFVLTVPLSLPNELYINDAVVNG